jgi:hypothetical protein
VGVYDGVDLFMKEDEFDEEDCGRCKELLERLRPGGGGIAGDMLDNVPNGALTLLLFIVPRVRSGEGDITLLCTCVLCVV